MNLVFSPIAIFSLFSLCLFFFANYVIQNAPGVLGLVTVNTIIANSYVWNLATSCFYEKSILKLFFDFVGMCIYMSYPVKYEPVDQFALYFALSILSCTIGMSIWCFARFFFTGMESMLIEPIFGFGGVLIILLMHARTQIPNEMITKYMPNLTFNNLPVVILFIQLICWLIGLRFLASDISFSFIGLIFSWSYLRYYIKNNVNNFRYYILL